MWTRKLFLKLILHYPRDFPKNSYFHVTVYHFTFFISALPPSLADLTNLENLNLFNNELEVSILGEVLYQKIAIFRRK